VNNLDKFFKSDVEFYSKKYFSYLSRIFRKLDLNEINQFVETLLEARDNNSSIFFIGNGGSAATASHFANDISIGTNQSSRPFKAFSLTDNIPIITAVGNDYGYDSIFSKQLQVYSKNGDVLVAISASGNSKNLLSAFEYAKKNRLKTVAITAFDGGQLRKLADQCIHVPTETGEYGPAEDVHMILDHLISSYLMRLLKNE